MGFKFDKYLSPLRVSEFIGIPFSLLQQDALQTAGVFSDNLLEDLARIISYYDIYEKGVQVLEGEKYTDGEYLPADLSFMRAAVLIDKQARFAFSKAPEFTLNLDENSVNDDALQAGVSLHKTLLDKILEKNKFDASVLRAFKDACIGERVAFAVDFDDVKGIKISFLPSYSFTYKLDDFGNLSRITTFHSENDEKDLNKQVIYRKRWEMVNGKCTIEVQLFDGTGQPIEDSRNAVITSKFEYIPARVILNDGLTGDIDGESDIKRLGEYEYWYSRLANADFDAGEHGMHPIRYAIDMAKESTDRDKLSLSPGAFWDLSTDTELNMAEGTGNQGKVGILEPSMSYSDALSKSLDRIASAMNEAVDVPDISADSMSGVITSGKSLKAIYWPLTVRCDEKMLEWLPALQFLAETVLHGCMLYPLAATKYIGVAPPKVGYQITVENPYSLPEDEIEERTADMAEVVNGLGSRKRFMKKWYNFTDQDADNELAQIVKEREMFNIGSVTTLQTRGAVTTSSTLTSNTTPDVEDIREQLRNNGGANVND